MANEETCANCGKPRLAHYDDDQCNVSFSAGPTREELAEQVRTLTGALSSRDEQIAELRAEVSAWREAMPDCTEGANCTRKATQVAGPNADYYSCDDPACLTAYPHSVAPFKDLPWADLVRKADGRKGG
jgi:hypothetical protein